MSLKEKLDVLKAGSAKKFSQEIRQTMQQSIENIHNSAIMQRCKKTGDKAPDFQLENAEGHTVSLNKLLTDGPLVLNFYRGKW